MQTPKSRPVSSNTSYSSANRKLSASNSSFVKSPNSLTRLFSAQSNRASLGNIKDKIFDGTGTPLEPSTPSSFTTTIKSRPFSRGLKASVASDLITPLHSPKESKGQLTSILEAASKSYRDPLSVDEREFQTNVNIKKDSIVLESFQKITKNRTSTNKESKHVKISFADIVGATIKKERREKTLNDETKQIQRNKEREQSLAKPINHSDIDLPALKEDDRIAIEDYENEFLGTYKNYKEIKNIKSPKVLKRVNYLKLFRLKLREESKQLAILSMIKARKWIRKYLAEKNLTKIIEELKNNIKTIIKLNDVELLTGILTLVSETYLDFGQLDNSIFAYNQLRMACELTDNIPLKIESYMGIAEACKRLKFFDHALIFLKRALHFCWNILDRERELKIYDQMGLIYFTMHDINRATYYHARASQGRIEKENSPLYKLTNESIKEFRFKNHLCLKHVAPIFFAKLTIPRPQSQQNILKTKLGREKLRALLIPKREDNEDHYFEEEITINQASAFLEKVLTRVHHKMGTTQGESPLFGTLRTDIEAIHQLEVILTESDFINDIPSPRTFDIKEHIEQGQLLKGFEQVKRTEGNWQEKKIRVFSAVQYHHLKKDRSIYSLQQIAKENHLNLKSPTGELETAMGRSELFISFDTFKKQAKKQFQADVIESKLFLNHLSPNRNTHGLQNVPELKPSRYQTFYEKALEYMVYEKEKLEIHKIKENTIP